MGDRPALWPSSSLHLCGPPGSAWVAGSGLESCYWGAEQEVGLVLVAAPGAAVCPFLVRGRIRLSSGARHLPSGITQATPRPAPRPGDPGRLGSLGQDTGSGLVSEARFCPAQGVDNTPRSSLLIRTVPCTESCPCAVKDRLSPNAQ